MGSGGGLIRWGVAGAEGGWGWVQGGGFSGGCSGGRGRWVQLGVIFRGECSGGGGVGFRWGGGFSGGGGGEGSTGANVRGVEWEPNGTVG